MLTASTLSPGERVLTTAASMTPEPLQVRMRTSFSVARKGRSPSVTRSRMAPNSGPRWFIIWPLRESSTSGGQAVGPGIRKLTNASSWMRCIDYTGAFLGRATESLLRSRALMVRYAQSVPWFT